MFILPVGFDDGPVVSRLRVVVKVQDLESTLASHLDPVLSLLLVLEREGHIPEGEVAEPVHDQVPIQFDGLVPHVRVLADDPVPVCRWWILSMSVSLGGAGNQDHQAHCKKHEGYHG